MACSDGMGAFMGMTVTRAFDDTTSGSNLTDAQALIRTASQAITVSSSVIVRSFSEWTVTQDVFDAPRLEDDAGAFRRKRFGCDRDHSSWTAVIEYNGTFDLSLLVGAEGTIRRTNPDGSYWEGNGRIVGGTVLTNQAAGEESLGEITVQWTGGKAGASGVVAYTSA